MISLKTLRERLGVRALLSQQDSNPKVAKNAKVGQMTAVLHLAPGNMSGHEVCPKRSAGCTAACLHFAGNPLYYTAKTTSRIARTKALFANRNDFMNLLALEISSHIKKARKLGLSPSVRLNGTSDICFEAKKFVLYPEVAAQLVEANKLATNVIELFPTTIFYDYTALPNRRPPTNYHLTFSMKENNSADVAIARAKGWNIAVVFPTSKLPTEYIGLPVINGDDHDFRPLDATPCVVGLKVKGAAGKGDLSGFVQRTDNSPRYLVAA
jgi:hypothetical protein